MQNYNQVYQVKDVTSGDPTEPVTVQECKDYMRLSGFQDTESDSTPFTEDDDLIERLIVAARKKLEKVYQISIVPKTLRSVIANLAGDIEIPQGPVVSITSVTDRKGNAVTDYEIVGYSELQSEYNDFIQLQCPQDDKLVIIYDAGYDEVPEAIRVEILRMVAYFFTNRGEDVKDFAGYQYSSGEYNRNTWLA